MNVRALMNRLEDIGEDRDVVVRIELEVAGLPLRGKQPALEYDVVGCDTPEDGTAVLVLRGRRDIAPEETSR